MSFIIFCHLLYLIQFLLKSLQYVRICTFLFVEFWAGGENKNFHEQDPIKKQEFDSLKLLPSLQSNQKQPMNDFRSCS